MLEDRLHNKVRYPVYATPKIDGIRVFTGEYVPMFKDNLSVAMCRSMLQLPNKHVASVIGRLAPGFDGEAVTYCHRDLFQQLTMHPFHQVQSDLMTEVGVPTFLYHVFACHVIRHRTLFYTDMVELLKEWDAPDFVVKVLPTKCNSPEELKQFMAKCVAEGHEGICFRTRSSPQWKWSSKDGRSTFSEQWLVKWKLFNEAEAEVIGFEEEMHNSNEATRDLRGLQVRSSYQSGMIGKNRLGALVCRTPGGVKFNIGIGFTEAQRENMWLAQAALLGQLVTYKSQTHGMHEAPRIPVFKAIRDPRDIS